MSEAVAGRPAAAEDVAPGRLLARLRTERKLSVADVAQRLKYAVRQIEALEAEEFSRLPGTTFVRGMVRGYAKLLEIDAEPLLKSLEKRLIPGAATVDLRAKRVPFPDGTKRRRGTRTYAILSLLMLAAVGGVLYEWRWGGGFPALPALVRPQVAQAPAAPEPAAAPAAQAEAVPEKPAAPAPVAQAPSPAPAPAPATVKAPPVAKAPQAVPVKEAKNPGVSGRGRIFMAFADDAWVEITDGEGKLLMAQLNPAGSNRLVTGNPPFSLVIGNAAAVRVVYNEKAVDLMPYVKVEVARLTLK